MFTSFEVITFYCSVFKDQLRLYNTVLWRLDYNNRFTISCQQLFLIFFNFLSYLVVRKLKVLVSQALNVLYDIFKHFATPFPIFFKQA